MSGTFRSRLAFSALALVLSVPPSFAAAPKAARKAAPKKIALVEGQGVKVTLKTGTVIEGIYHGDADGALWVEVDGGEVGIEKATIAGVAPAMTGSNEYKERASALGVKDAAGWWELSLWAAGKELHGAAESAAKTVLKIDPEHANARDFLGYEKVGKRWVQGDDIHVAKGLVLFERQWLSPDQIEALKERRRTEDKEKNLRGMMLHAPVKYEQAPSKRPMGGWVDSRQGGN